MKDHECDYPAHDLELAIVVFALKQWRYYLLREMFEVITDYKSLEYISTQKNLNMREGRWLEMLCDYAFKVKYHPGTMNIVTNALSRKKRVMLAGMQVCEWHVLKDLLQAKDDKNMQKARLFSLTAQLELLVKVKEAQQMMS